jgi:hypothetical protein
MAELTCNGRATVPVVHSSRTLPFRANGSLRYRGCLMHSLTSHRLASLQARAEKEGVY